MLRNPFFVNMTVGVPDAPIPASFDEHEHWGEDGGLSVLFRKKMTAILWNACEQTGDDPYNCEYWLSENDSGRKWHGPPFDKVLSLIHISEPTRQAESSYAVFCLKKKK